MHSPPGGDAGLGLRALAAAEGALRSFRALGLPPPLADGRLGGSDAFDLYVGPPGSEARAEVDLPWSGEPFDRGSVFGRVPSDTLSRGCGGASDVARVTAQAIALRLDAALEPGALAMASSYAAELVAPCSVRALAAVDDAQLRPERSLFGGSPARLGGELLLPWFFDDAWGVGQPGHVFFGFLALAAQRSRPEAWAWENEPDVFDAVRASLRARGSTLDAALLEFAVARAFVGDRSDEGHLRDVARFGAAGRVRFEWAVDFGSLPRRLAPARPIEATGASYVWLDLRSAPKGAELTFVADWEAPALFRWALVKVREDGAEAGRIDLAGIFGSTHAERTVASLDGLAGILVVGANTGSVDRSRPYDPDEDDPLARSYTVTLAR